MASFKSSLVEEPVQSDQVGGCRSDKGSAAGGMFILGVGVGGQLLALVQLPVMLIEDACRQAVPLVVMAVLLLELTTTPQFGILRPELVLSLSVLLDEGFST